MPTEVKTGCWSALTFGHASPLIKKGVKQVLRPEDIPEEPLPSEQIRNLEFRFNRNWQKERCQDRPSLYSSLKATFKSQFYAALTYHALREGLSLVFPIFFNLFIASFEKERDIESRIILGGAVILVMFIQGILQPIFTFKSLRTALGIRAVLSNAVFNKTTVLSRPALSKIGGGRVTNVVSQDCESLYMLLNVIYNVFTAPARFIGTVILLFYFIGPSFAFALVVPLISIPISIQTTKAMMKVRAQSLIASDSRVKLTTEVMAGIKAVKLGAYEDELKDKVVDKRLSELGFLRMVAIYRSVLFSVMFVQPVLMTLLVFVIQVYRGVELSASNSFTAIILIMSLSMPLMAASTAVARLADGKISIRRLEAVLLNEEISELQSNVDVMKSEDIGDVLIEFKDASFNYLLRKVSLSAERKENKMKRLNLLLKKKKKANEFELNKLNCCIKSGEFYVVAGTVASGKTSFLLSLLGELNCCDGKVQRLQNLFVGYSSQHPWLLNSSIKSNIVIDEDLDSSLYQSIVDTCALLPDFEQLINGDQTVVGERGVSLSGGQQARVALARCLYQTISQKRKECNVMVLLDDPISAVDSRSATHILERTCKLLSQNGIAMVLATHHVNLVKSQSKYDFKILILEDSTIAAQGSFSELETHPFLASVLSSLPAEEDLRRQSVDTGCVEVDVDDTVKVKEEMKGGEEEENVTEGTVKFAIFKKYFKALGGAPMVFLVLVLFMTTQALLIVSDLNLSVFLESDDQSLPNFLKLFASFRLGNSLFTVGSMTFLFLAMLKASKNLHSDMISGLVRSPIRFFESTPLGRIQNRVSRDLTNADNNLAFAFNFGLTTYISVFASLVLISFILPYFIVFVPFLSVLFYILQKYYRKTSRQLSRLQATLKSPVFSVLSETVTGISVIRAGQMEPMFVEKFKKRLDHSSGGTFSVISANCWLSFRLALLSAFVMIFVVGFIVMAEISAAYAGVTLSHAFHFLHMLGFVVIATVELESSMASVERIVDYIELPSENYLPKGSSSLSKEWPATGSIEIDKLSLRYREGLPQAIKELSLSIEGGERIGVCGRSGSGKTSLMMALFMIVVPEKLSKILIDNVDIRTVPLQTLRSVMASIPQDPVLFSGNLRDNIDLRKVLTDDEVIDLLKKAQLNHLANQEGLKKVIADNGSNLSSGERQLVCLARAIGRQSKIIVIDEATSSTDFATDQAIQKVLRESFGNTTVITIAHRLDTILNYDRIVVLDSGEVIEVGKPSDLLSNLDSHFSRLVNELGDEQAQRLRELVVTNC
ncbi:hypothetical protein GEMRC1_011312 [Eukaryota sp. GEM-RC1]